MYKVIILFSLQRSQKASNLQLLQLLIISRTQLPTLQSLICLTKCLSQATLMLLVVQLLLLTLMRYQGFKSRYQDLLQVFALKIKQSVITQPITLIVVIKVTYLQSPYQTLIGLERLSNTVTTLTQFLMPIVKPVLLKLQVSLSQILYLALIFCTRLNQGLITSRSLQRTLQQSLYLVIRNQSLGSRLTKFKAYQGLTGSALRIARS